MLDDAPQPHTPAAAEPEAPVPSRGPEGNGAARRRRAAFFLHEPAGSARASGLRVGLIADGTTRGGPNGIAQGAGRVIACAEHCAVRGDVELVAVFILSPKNLARRKRPFFAALHAEFLRLLEGVASGRLLSGIRVEIHGRLDRLRNKGGAAARLADVAELLEETTRALPAPRMRLALCLDYGESAPIALGLDLLVRTGMEAPSVMRLSGLRVRPETLCLPSTKLWRDFTPADLDAAVAMVPAGSRMQLAPGHSVAFVEELLEQLATTDLGGPVRITVPVAAPDEEVSAMLARAARGPLDSCESLTVTVQRRPRGPARRVGPRNARVHVRLVSAEVGSTTRLGAEVGWIAPGQTCGELRLLERRIGDANVHPCDPTPAAVIDALRRALAFEEEHPPLHGAPRAQEARGQDEGERLRHLLLGLPAWEGVPAEVVARQLCGGREPDIGAIGEVFAARCLLEARSSGLMSGEVAWERQALGYGLTAFAIGYSPSAVDVAGRGWEPRTAQLAHVMLSLAASDEEISDRVFGDEREDQRRARLGTSVDYLVAAIEGERRPVPDIAGARVLEAIAHAWTRFFAEGARRADRTLVDGVRQTAAALYRANLTELSADDGLFDALLECPGVRAAEALVEHRAPSAPRVVKNRIRELLSEACGAPERSAPEVWRELRLLCRLVRVAPSIGAGCALLAMTATEPAEAVPAGAPETLLRTASLMDCYFRLVNDLAFDDLSRGDRDRKPTTFTCLVPAGLRGKAREQACVAALQTCLTTAAWLRAEIRRGLAALWQVWPLAARWWQRGAHFGRRVYERGHYDRLTREVVAAILVELEGLTAPESRETRPDRSNPLLTVSSAGAESG